MQTPTPSTDRSRNVPQRARYVRTETRRPPCSGWPSPLTCQPRGGANHGPAAQLVPAQPLSHAMSGPGDITQCLQKISEGDTGAATHLIPLLYEELRRLAAARLAKEPEGQTLQATALVHEAYLRLVGTDPAKPWNNRGHFFGAAAEAMRRILVENARRKAAQKRGGEWERVSWTDHDLPMTSADDHILAVHEALDRLEREDPQAAALVKLRFFAGLTGQEAAAALGLAERSATRLWAYARAWLYRELGSAS